jgi:hypothetical protein
VLCCRRARLKLSSPDHGLAVPWLVASRAHWRTPRPTTACARTSRHQQSATPSCWCAVTDTCVVVATESAGRVDPQGPALMTRGRRGLFVGCCGDAETWAKWGPTDQSGGAWLVTS